jgi:hypothetical protein
VSEADIAQLYIRDVVTAAANGGEKFFWFSQVKQTTRGGVMCATPCTFQ